MSISTLTPNYEPHTIVAGDNIIWYRTFEDYDPVNYTLSYALMPTEGDRITITAADQGDHETFKVDITGTTSAGYAPGDYLWQAYMTDGSSNRKTLFPGRMTIKPDFSTALVQDYRSTVDITLANLYAVVENKATSDQMHYTIRGRSLSRMQPKELLDWINFYEALKTKEIRREAREQGRESKGKIKVRLVSNFLEYIPNWLNKGGGEW